MLPRTSHTSPSPRLIVPRVDWGCGSHPFGKDVPTNSADTGRSCRVYSYYSAPYICFSSMIMESIPCHCLLYTSSWFDQCHTNFDSGLFKNIILYSVRSMNMYSVFFFYYANRIHRNVLNRLTNSIERRCV